MSYVHVTIVQVSSFALGPGGEITTRAPIDAVEPIAERVADDRQLGRFLFARRSAMLGAWFGLGFVLLIAAALVAVGARNGTGGTAVVGVFVLVVAAVPMWLLIRGPRPLQFHERGIVLPRSSGEPVRIGYHEIDEISYQITRHYANGIYSGSRATIQIKPALATGAKPLKYSGKYPEKGTGFLKKIFTGGDALDGIHVAVSMVIAQRMLARVQSGEAVAWGKKATISKTGVSRGSRSVTLDEIDRVLMNDGVVAVFARDQAKPSVSVPAAEFNQLAGFIVLRDLLGRRGVAFQVV